MTSYKPGTKKFLFILVICGACLQVIVGGSNAAGPSSIPPLENGFRLVDALVLGLVEGVTEYLPVSSTGHLLLAQYIMGPAATEKTKQAADAYAIIIQIGAILAVVGLYRRRIGQMILGLLGRDAKGLRLVVMLFLAFIPAALVGLSMEDEIKARLFGPWPVIAGWMAGGIAILAKPWKSTGRGDAGYSSVEDIQWRQALIIGLLQVFALWPGVSRSLATIMGGLIAGLGLSAAVEFSFLLGLITLGAATLYEMLECGGSVVTAYGTWLPLVGILCSFVSAWLSVKWLVAYVQTRGLAVFGYYRLLVAVTTGVFLLTGIL